MNTEQKKESRNDLYSNYSPVKRVSEKVIKNGPLQEDYDIDQLDDRHVKIQKNLRRQTATVTEIDINSIKIFAHTMK